MSSPGGFTSANDERIRIKRRGYKLSLPSNDHAGCMLAAAHLIYTPIGALVGNALERDIRFPSSLELRKYSSSYIIYVNLPTTCKKRSICSRTQALRQTCFIDGRLSWRTGIEGKERIECEGYSLRTCEEQGSHRRGKKGLRI